MDFKERFMDFYYQNKKVIVDRNTIFDGFQIDRLFNYIDQIKKYGTITEDKIRSQKGNLKGIRFKVKDMTYYSSISEIDICPRSDFEKIKLNGSIPNTLYFDFQKNNDILMLIVNQRCKESDFPISEGKETLPLNVFDGVNTGKFQFEVIENPIDKLESYKKYFEYLLDDLKNHKTEFIVDVNMIREYYWEFLQEIADERSLMIPIKGTIGRTRIKSIEIKYTEENYPNETGYTLQDADFSLIGSEEERTFIDKLQKDFDIKLNWTKQHRFCRITNMQDNEMLNMEHLIKNEHINEIKICEDIRGEEIKIKRILHGINSVEKKQVANQSLVNCICSNTIERFKNNYISNFWRMEKLKSDYPKLSANPEQMETIEKILSMQTNNVDILLVQGPPGTGKTELIIALAKELLKNKYTTLITSNVHVACDNIVERMRNDKEIILKRYKRVNDSEERIINQQTYLVNQVLSKFEIDDKAVESEETLKKHKSALSKLVSKLEDLENENLELEKNNLEYTKKIEKFEKVKEELNTAELAFEELKNKENSIIANGLTNIMREFDTPQVAIQSIEKENDKLSDEVLTLTDSNTNLKDEITEIEDFRKNKDQYISNYNSNINTLEEDILHIIDLDISSIQKLIKNNVSSGVKIYEQNRFLDFEDVNRIIDLLNILKNDYSFWNYNRAVNKYTINQIKSHKDSSYLGKLSSNANNQIEKIQTYQSLSLIDKFFMLFGAERCGITYTDYKEAKYNLHSILLNFRNDYSNHIQKIINKKFSEEYFNSEINKKEKEIANLKEKVEILKEKAVNGEKIKKENNNQIKENTKKITILEKQKNENSECIKGLLTLLQTRDEIEQNEKSINKIRIKLNTADEDIKLFEKENRRSILSYKKFKNSYQVNKANLENEINKLKTAIDFIDKCQSTLSVNNENTVLFDYIKELNEIKHSEPEQLNRYFDGQTLSFSSEFNVDKNDKNGSLISMTTSQIARLFRKEDKDENDIVFDYAIVDEASKCSFEDLIISLPKIKHLVLIGDYMQLDPFYDSLTKQDTEIQEIMNFNENNWTELKKSVFSLLLKQAVNKNYHENIKSFSNNSNVSVMKRQYRMNKGIFDLISPIYKINDGFEILDLKNKQSDDVVCLNIMGGEEKVRIIGTEDKAYSNEKEADYIVRILNYIQENRKKLPQIKTIGVITGYSDQEKLLRKKLKRIEGLQIGTFDRFQGREYDLVLVSLVRTNGLGFLKDIRRMNVAFSRAKRHLVILGNFDKISTFTLQKQSSELSPEQREETYVQSTLIPQLKLISEECNSFDFAIKRIQKMLEAIDE